ncbi:MAG: hypothetical protein BWY82_02750 [Verrucomicrobia bacterium ADurb.Bin474]|nr:MAG: hypothetical protein BWY82_02750 [Verrucomicrobia bacterium ADurb.Bin474]
MNRGQHPRDFLYARGLDGLDLGRAGFPLRTSKGKRLHQHPPGRITQPIVDVDTASIPIQDILKGRGLTIPRDACDPFEQCLTQ